MCRNNNGSPRGHCFAATPSPSAACILARLQQNGNKCKANHATRHHTSPYMLSDKLAAAYVAAATANDCWDRLPKTFRACGCGKINLLPSFCAGRNGRRAGWMDGLGWRLSPQMWDCMQGGGHREPHFFTLTKASSKSTVQWLKPLSLTYALLP